MDGAIMYLLGMVENSRDSHPRTTVSFCLARVIQNENIDPEDDQAANREEGRQAEANGRPVNFREIDFGDVDFRDVECRLGFGRLRIRFLVG